MVFLCTGSPTTFSNVVGVSEWHCASGRCHRIKFIRQEEFIFVYEKVYIITPRVKPEYIWSSIAFLLLSLLVFIVANKLDFLYRAIYLSTLWILFLIYQTLYIYGMHVCIAQLNSHESANHNSIKCRKVLRQGDHSTSYILVYYIE